MKSLRAMNAGDAADQVLRQLDKMIRNNERASRDSRLNKVIYSVTEFLYLLLKTKVSGLQAVKYIVQKLFSELSTFFFRMSSYQITCPFQVIQPRRGRLR